MDNEKGDNKKMDNKPDQFTAKLISLNRITIPEELRKLWNIEGDDYVTLKILRVVKAEPIAKEV